MLTNVKVVLLDKHVILLHMCISEYVEFYIPLHMQILHIRITFVKHITIFVWKHHFHD